LFPISSFSPCWCNVKLRKKKKLFFVNEIIYEYKFFSATELLVFFFVEQGVRTDIRRKHRHPSQVGTPENLSPMPLNSNILLKNGKIYTRKGGIRQNPQKKNKQKTNKAETDYNKLRKPVVRQANSVTREIQMQLRRKRV